MLAFYENVNMPLRIFLSENMNFRAHLHRQVEMIYVLEGGVLVGLDFKTRMVNAGEMALILPNVVHCYETPENTRCIIMIFDIKLVGDYINIFTHQKCREPFLAYGDVHKDIPYCLNAILSEYTQSMDILLIKGYIYVLLARIFEKLTFSEKQPELDAELIHQALMYIDKNFRNDITLDVLSRELGISKYYLSRIFSSKIGSNLNLYINTLRVTLAQHLLEVSSLSITEIAYECGFKSQRSFNRAFHQICGIPPSAYRKGA